MNTSKKWMVSLSTEKYEWVKRLADEAEVPGSAIIDEALSRVMRDREFRTALVEAKTMIKIRDLTEKKASLEEEIKMLRSKGGQLAKVFA